MSTEKTEKATMSAADVDTSPAAGANRGGDTASVRTSRFVIVAAMACAVIGATVAYSSFDSNGGADSFVYQERKLSSTTDASAPFTHSRGMQRLLASEPGDDAAKEEALVEKIAKKLTPVSLRYYGDEGEEELIKVEEITAAKKENLWGPARHIDYKKTMVPHQFLHLHHMKTGGTSIDRLLRCSMDRLRKEGKVDVPYYSIHECSRQRFATCLSDKENRCRVSMDQASVMSYCSALKFLDEFGWWYNNNAENKVKAFTVLRHPVDRVWSMFRFQTKHCYKCQSLKDIYTKLDSGEDTGVDKLCLDQLRNHEVNNLLSTQFPVEVSELDPKAKDYEDTKNKMVAEAIENMKGFFTVVGITEELTETAKILGTVFPWMDLEGKAEYETTSECALPHANASPKNNRCGEGNTHWELPKQPDQETHDLIVKHNKLDMELYEAAVSYFQLQKKALAAGAGGDNK